jgi:hypothetical protein
VDAFGVVYLQSWLQPKPKVRFVVHFAILKVTHEKNGKLAIQKPFDINLPTKLWRILQILK